jgi:hypothetical protein
MPVARPDREAEPSIEGGRSVEVADGVHDVIKTAGHGLIFFPVLHLWGRA